MGVRLQAQQLQHFLYGFQVPLGHVPLKKWLAPQQHRVKYRAVREFTGLGHIADPLGQIPPGKPVDRQPVHQHLPRLGADDAVDTLEHGGLSHTVCPQHRHALPRTDGEGHALHHLALWGVAVPKVTHFQPHLAFLPLNNR